MDRKPKSDNSNPIRVLIADDHPIVRAGIKTMIEKEPDLCVVSEIAEGDRVETLTRQWQPDVLVLDINMPGLDPVAATRALKKHRPDLNILVLTAYDDDAYVTGLLSAGATGYLLKEEALDTLVMAIRAVAGGESWLSQRVAGRLARKAIAPARTATAEPLTPREREVLRLLALGLNNDEIAAKLFISKRTVQNHVSNIYGKLDLDSRAEAVLYAIRHEVVDVSEVKDP
ncbi:MAG: response regulator transcription factor [Chloroflexi bacterium]|nr:response regulator transcription factor [Chloroflexota bacterium]